MKWILLGHGSYNMAYRNEDSTLVFKAALNDSPTDVPERSVRLWNLLNPHIKPLAEISKQKINGKWVKGWTCPFVRGVQASDKQIREKLLDIFNRTGRIIMDAVASNNFLQTPSGEIVCIDIGHALEMEHRQTAALVGLPRKPSFTSLETYVELYDPRESDWLKKNEKDFPKSIRTIKALSFIKIHRPDITNVNFLKVSPKTIKLLAEAYDKGKGRAVKQALDLLEVKRSPDLENSKRKTREILWEYLSKKGTVVNNEHFIPYTEYRFDEPHLQQMMALMRQINTAKTCDECSEIVSNYIAALPSIDVEPEITPHPDKPSPEKQSQDSDDFSYFLEDLENDIDNMMVLNDLKSKCRVIFENILLGHGIEPDIIPEIEIGNSVSMSEYKTELASARMNDKIEKLMRKIDFSSSFAEIMNCLDTFAEEMPVVVHNENQSDVPFTQSEALVASVNFCRVMIKSAMEVEKGHGAAPSMGRV